MSETTPTYALLVQRIRAAAEKASVAIMTLSRKRFRELDPEAGNWSLTNRGSNWGRAKCDAAGQDPAPPRLPAVPPGHTVKGASTFTNGQWIKTERIKENPRALAEWIFDAAPKKIPPLPQSPAPRVVGSDDLLAVYPLGDLHLGMYAHRAETGADWNRQSAMDVAYAAIDHLANAGTPAAHGLLINVGDFYHVSSPAKTTVKGTPQDTDGHFYEAILDGIELKRRMIQRLLEVHEHVTVFNRVGNHDGMATLNLVSTLQAYFKDEPRVTIEWNPSAADYMLFGKCLIASTHGDTYKKPAELTGIMAQDMAEAWFRSDGGHRHWFNGHVHHKTQKEITGAIVETVRTLIRSDGWHHRAGYRSGRDMQRVLFHKAGCELERWTFSPQVLGL